MRLVASFPERITLPTLHSRLSTRTSPNLEDLPCELVAGDHCIHEELLGLKFRISPHSFFQVGQFHSFLSTVTRVLFQTLKYLIRGVVEWGVLGGRLGYPCLSTERAMSACACNIDSQGQSPEAGLQLDFPLPGGPKFPAAALHPSTDLGCVCLLRLQVNTGAAELLYSAVGEWAQLDQDSTVLDVCCGTGTIGISLAKVGTARGELPFLVF